MSMTREELFSASRKNLDRRIHDARRAAEALKGRGLHFEAEAVAKLCRTASSLHETARRLSSDLAELRGK